MWRSVVRSAVALALAATLGACDLEVTNPNSPSREEAWDNPAAVESAISGAFEAWFAASYQTGEGGVGRLLSTASFQHSTPFCHPSYYSTLPRQPLPDPANPYYEYSTDAWYALNETLAQVAFAMRSLADDPTMFTDEGERTRLRAFGRFVQGLGHGSLALLYARAVVVDENTLPEPENSLAESEDRLLEYREVMQRALGYLYEAAELSAGADWPAIPAEWMSVEVSPDQLARLAHSYAARFRAAVARRPHQRAGIDWQAVIADVDAGITGSWVMDMSCCGDWYNPALAYNSAPTWALETYFIIGMADQSGSYRRWLLRDLHDRIPNADVNGDGTPDPTLIETPDTRFPQGSTLAEQEANPGSLYAIPDGLEGELGGEPRAWNIQSSWIHPERGTWRWSYYWNVETEPYGRGVDGHWPEISLAEMRLLKAEALLNRGRAGEAAALINVSRTAAGLSPTDAGGTNVECVPRLPDGSCGDLMEMLKWEKRLETRMKGLFGAPWYFDGRRWGDLYAGTFLHFSVPCEELKKLDEPCVTVGGPAGQDASPGSVYSWFDEN